MDDRERRLAKNEAFFRELNENIRSVATTLGGGDSYEYLCECSDSGCTVRIELTIDEYERVRGDGTRFFVAGGHTEPEVERVVEHRDGYVVVEKAGAAAAVAAARDPRA
jgi:hypothetical protein